MNLFRFVRRRRPLRIAINAQMERGMTGGIETAVTETIHALGKLSASTGDEDEYLVIGPRENSAWLAPYLCGKQRLVRGPRPSRRRPRAHHLEAPGGSAFFQSLECDVVHFPFQTFAHCKVPTIYSPHDLQHLHFPEFFEAAEIQLREAIYRQACHESETIIAGTQWIAHDLAAKYQLAPEKIQVVQWAPPADRDAEVSAATLARVKEKYNLRAPFALYPAATWEHKNHLRLMEALKQLRERGQEPIDLICTGQQTPHFQHIERQRSVFGLHDAVHFVGRVPREELRALYRLARFVFIPTLFEAASAPLFEAWREGVPVACATVTALPEQAGDAALLFDPFSTEEIAQAFHRMQTDEDLRRGLLAHGQRRLEAFSWDRTATAFRAIYRRAAGRALSEEERNLLTAMNGPNESEGTDGNNLPVRRSA